MKEVDIDEWFNSQYISPKNFKTKIIKVIKYKNFYECFKNKELEKKFYQLMVLKLLNKGYKKFIINIILLKKKKN